MPLGAAFRERFEVLRPLGEGAMGIVLLARDRQLGREVAVKITKALRGDQLERFLREGRILASLRHPGIVQVFDLGVDEGRPYLVCELSSGVTLDTVVRERLPLPRILGILRSMAEALAEAHEQGVIHRDLKPENVQLVGETSVKILDFGLALPVDMAGALTEPGLVLGTPAYMSPEQVMNGQLQGTTDQFSLGVVAFEMVTGAFPFGGATVMETASARLTETPPAPSTLTPGIPAAIDAMILRLLEREPASRYSSMRVLVEALDAIEVGPGAPPAGSRALRGSRSKVTHVTKSGSRSMPSRASMATRALQSLNAPTGMRPVTRWAAGSLVVALLGASAWLLRSGDTTAPPAPVLVSASPSAIPAPPTAQQVQLLQDLHQVRAQLHECHLALGRRKEKGKSGKEDAMEARVLALTSRFGPLVRRARAALHGPSWLEFEAELRPALELCGRLHDRIDPMGGPIWSRLQGLSGELLDSISKHTSEEDPFRSYAIRMLALSTDKLLESAVVHYVLQRWVGFEELARVRRDWAVSPAGRIECLRAASLVAHRGRLSPEVLSRAVTSLTETLPGALERYPPATAPDRAGQRVMLQSLVCLAGLLGESRIPEPGRAAVLAAALQLTERLRSVPEWMHSWPDEFPPVELSASFDRIAQVAGPGPESDRIAAAGKRLRPHSPATTRP